MNPLKPRFREHTCAQGCLLQDPVLCAEGVVHAFCGQGYNARTSDPAAVERQLESFGVRHLLLPQQVHGTAIWDLRPEPKLTLRSRSTAPEADALIAPRAELASVDTSGGGIAIAIRTADCVPILLVSEKSVALVHAGWRGLAAGIVQAAIEKFAGEVLDARIGPCAGGELYEVGPEVLAAFDSTGCVQRNIAQGICLDLASTAAKIICSYAQVRSCVFCDVCTIRNTNYYSHRRQGADAGRNLSWVLTGLGFEG